MVPIRKKQLHYRNCFRWWEQRESNPRPSACKADALNQLSYAPVFRFFFHIAASDFVSSVGHYREVTPSLLTRLPCTAKKQTSKLFLLKNCPLREVSPKGIAKVDKISVFPNFFGKIQKFRVAESKGMIICLSLFRKPSFLDSLFLLEQFQY